MPEPIRLSYDAPLQRGQVRAERSESGVLITIGPPSGPELWNALESTLTVFIPLSIVIALILAERTTDFNALRREGEIVILFGLLGWWWVNCLRSLLMIYRRRRGPIQFLVTADLKTLPWSDRNGVMSIPRAEIVNISVDFKRNRLWGFTCSLRIDGIDRRSLWMLNGMNPVTLLAIVTALRECVGLKEPV